MFFNNIFMKLASMFVLLSLKTNRSIFAVKRGPHHPKSEVSDIKNKLDTHLTFEEHSIAEDLEDFGTSFNAETMTEAEKHFIYFKAHDNDNNNALDGLEMLYAAIHQENKSIDGGLQIISNELDHIIGVIDEFLLIADTNKDGYLNYPEYIRAINENAY